MPAKAATARAPRRVREGPAEPTWVSRAIVEAMHDAQIREHGGSPGIRDSGLLDSAINRPRNKWAYGEQDVAVLAAAYAFGIAKNHAFVDGNKRSALVVAGVFLEINGYEFVAPEPEVVDVMNRLASGKLTEAAFAEWVRQHITRI